MSLPPDTYGVRCEFNPGGQRYTYLVDLLHHGVVQRGDHVIVASPKGGYKVILVVDITEDLAPVDLQYMKYIVQKVNTEYYNVLMNNLTGGPDSKVYADKSILKHNLLAGDEKPQPSTSPLIDEGDTMNLGNPSHHSDLADRAEDQ